MCQCWMSHSTTDVSQHGWAVGDPAGTVPSYPNQVPKWLHKKVPRRAAAFPGSLWLGVGVVPLWGIVPLWVSHRHENQTVFKFSLFWNSCTSGISSACCWKKLCLQSLNAVMVASWMILVGISCCYASLIIHRSRSKFAAWFLGFEQHDWLLTQLTIWGNTIN